MLTLSLPLPVLNYPNPGLVVERPELKVGMATFEDLAMFATEPSDRARQHRDTLDVGRFGD